MTPRNLIRTPLSSPTNGLLQKNLINYTSVIKFSFCSYGPAQSKTCRYRNALSDGHLVVYYPHLLVHPEYHGKGIGRLILNKLQEKYGDFHQQILVADGKAIDFYQKSGFELAGETKSMWIYRGNDH